MPGNWQGLVLLPTILLGCGRYPRIHGEYSHELGGGECEGFYDRQRVRKNSGLSIYCFDGYSGEPNHDGFYEGNPDSVQLDVFPAGSREWDGDEVTCLFADGEPTAGCHAFGYLHVFWGVEGQQVIYDGNGAVCESVALQVDASEGTLKCGFDRSTDVGVPKEAPKTLSLAFSWEKGR